MTIDRVLGEDPEGKTPEEFRGDMGKRRGGGGAPGGGRRRASNMFADIAKGGHTLKEAAPFKVDPKMNLLTLIKKGAGGGGRLKHVEVGEKGGVGIGGGTARTSSPTRSSLRKRSSPSEKGQVVPL